MGPAIHGDGEDVFIDIEAFGTQQPVQDRAHLPFKILKTQLQQFLPGTP